MSISGKSLFFGIAIISAMILLIIFLLPMAPLLRFVLGLFALFFDILAFSTKYYTYLFRPLLKMKGRTIVLSADPTYRVAPSGNALIIPYSGMFLATAFVRIPIYRSATEMSQDERVDFAKMFSRMLTVSTDPVKFVSMLYVINKDDYISEIRDKLNEAEENYAMLSAKFGEQSNPQLERAKGEVTMWRNLFDNVSKVKSNALSNFAMVTAQGGTEEEALAIVAQKAEELAAGISAILGVSAYVMDSKEFLTFIEPELMIPFATISEQMQEKVASLGV